MGNYMGFALGNFRLYYHFIYLYLVVKTETTSPSPETDLSNTALLAKLVSKVVKYILLYTELQNIVNQKYKP